MSLDQRLLRIAVARQAEPVLIRQVRPFIKLDFEAKKEQFIKAFDADPVTQEIEAGPGALSQQQELANVGGNLFSLLGFFQEQSPIAQLREYLQDNIVLYRTSAGKMKGDKIRFDTTVIAPTETDINFVMGTAEDAKLYWTGRSWTELLARGISGLPNYLFDLTRDFSQVPSRSGPAIQSKGELRSAKMGPIPYISRVLDVLHVLFPQRR